jgi:hypothetical protein
MSLAFSRNESHLVQLGRMSLDTIVQSEAEDEGQILENLAKCGKEHIS